MNWVHSGLDRTEDGLAEAMRQSDSCAPQLKSPHCAVESEVTWFVDGKATLLERIASLRHHLMARWHLSEDEPACSVAKIARVLLISSCIPMQRYFSSVGHPKLEYSQPQILLVHIIAASGGYKGFMLAGLFALTYIWLGVCGCIQRTASGIPMFVS